MPAPHARRGPVSLAARCSRRSVSFAPALSALVAFALGGLFARPALAINYPTNFIIENAVPSTTFNTPVQVTFTPDGRMLVVEKRGTVWVVQNGVKRATPFVSIDYQVLNNGDRGLLSLAVDPNFTTNHYVYMLYTVDPDSNNVDTDDDAYSRLVRYRVSTADSNVLDVSTRAVLIGPDWRRGVPSGSPSHTIGTLRFGSDGTLLVSSGDGGQFNSMDKGGQDPNLFGATRTDPYEDIGAFRAQYLGSLAGKILRLDPATGLGLPSNPFYTGVASDIQSRVWCYGLRNPYRFNLRPGTGSTLPSAASPGTLYIGEVGWTSWEEENITATGGRNFGWPCYEGLGSNGSYQAATPTHDGCSTIGSRPGVLTAPSITYPHSGTPGASLPPGFVGNAAVGGAFYMGTRYPQQYRGAYFCADYGQGWINFALVDPNNTVLSFTTFATGAQGPVDIEVEPGTGDLLYISIDTGEVRRIRWTGAVDNNRPPVANGTATPNTGTAPLAVTFSSAGSSDPDGDPITFSWNFGDGQTLPLANPTHTYASGGVFNAILTVDDGKGGITRVTVVVTVNGAAAAFPSTPVLDNFNRANGAIGSPWVDPVNGLTSLAINSNALTHVCCNYETPIWSTTSFGPDQEAYITLGQLTAGSPEHDLMLKLQSATYSASHLEVRYDDAVGEVAIASYDPASGWVGRGTIAARFVSGDQLGARAFATGQVEVYKNGVKIGSANATGWVDFAKGGYIGLTLDRAYSSRLDDFGGGNINLNINTKPKATIVAPGNGSFFITGQNIALTGSGTDAQDAAGALQYKWLVDLHHNTHVHPAVFQFTETSAVYVGENHDDGTGVYDEIKLVVTDTGALTDTARVNIYPEIDLSPAGLAVLPAAPTAADPTTITFRVRNFGRMPAQISRWRLRAGATLLAERDTLVAALDSVLVTARIGAVLPVGTIALRVTVDTLATVTETSEANNAQTIALTVAPGPNRPPVAVASGTPTSGAAPLTVVFSSAGSSDPDADPLTYTWTFGDGTTLIAANPTKLYSVAGNFVATLTVSDGRGGSAQASVPITVSGVAGFPSTSILDDFNRADGAIGGSWVGDISGFVVTGNAATQNCCYVSAVWDGAVFGPNQEAYVTMTTASTTAFEQDLMLKVQGLTYAAGHIEIRYDATVKKVFISTHTPTTGWTQRGAAISVTFVNGDRLGARALADGTIQVYRNATLIGSTTTGNWPYTANGGRLGMTLDHASAARLDNYGGGNVVLTGPAALISGIAADPGDAAEASDALALSAPVSPVRTLALSNAFPNPTTGATRLSLELPRAGRVQLSVHDIQGREVWREAREYAAGRWTLDWSGRGRDGSRLPAGIYLAQIQAQGTVFMRRIALLP